MKANTSSRLVGEWTEKNCGNFTTTEIVDSFFHWVDTNEDFTPSEEAKERLTHFIEANPIVKYLWNAAMEIGYEKF